MASLRPDQIQLIWNQYKDEQDWQRHSESQRATLSQFLLAVSAALLALFPKSPLADDWLIPVFMIGIGLFGILAILKYRERFLAHVAVAAEYRKVLDAYFEPEDIGQKPQSNLFIQTLEKAIVSHNASKLFVFRANHFRQHWLWVGLFMLIVVLGVALLRKVPC